MRLLLLAIACFLTAAQGPFLIKNRRIIDQYGRERVFHGLNVVYKSAPYIPVTDSFDPKLSFCDQDAQLLQSLGLNVIRLGAQWAGVEPVRGQYNMTYIAQLKKIVNICAAHNISVFLDAHQDSFSERFCGEGVPLWAAKQNSSFPFPLEITPFAETELGVPSAADCNKHSWSSYQFSWAGGNGYADLYKNKDGLRDSFASFWALLAKEFKGVENIIGFELLNEPFAGNVVEDPFLLFPGHADKVNLQPFYDAIAPVIRAADPSRILMFEPCTWTDEFGFPLFDSGLSHAPGGSGFANTSLYAFHYYAYVNRGDPAKYFELRTRDAERFGTPMFVTETETQWLDFIEPFVHSWAEWEYKSFLPDASQTPLVPVCTGCGSVIFPNQNYSQDGARQLSRTYPQATQGTINKLQFNGTTNNFHLEFSADLSVTAPTIIFLNEDLRYPNGYQLSISTTLQVQKQITKNYVQFMVTAPSRTHIRNSKALAEDLELLVVVDISPK